METRLHNSNDPALCVNHRHARLLLATAALLFLTTGCYRGYKSASELESDDRGPTACAASCQELGLEMSAFVLVERQTSGCVCSPKATATQASSATAAAAAHLFMEEERRKQQEQQRQASLKTGP